MGINGLPLPICPAYDMLPYLPTLSNFLCLLVLMVTPYTFVHLDP